MNNQPIDAVTDEVHELVSGSLVDELAEAARRHDVMISITVTPYDQDVTVDVDKSESRGDD